MFAKFCGLESPFIQRDKDWLSSLKIQRISSIHDRFSDERTPYPLEPA